VAADATKKLSRNRDRARDFRGPVPVSTTRKLGRPPGPCGREGVCFIATRRPFVGRRPPEISARKTHVPDENPSAKADGIAVPAQQPSGPATTPRTGGAVSRRDRQAETAGSVRHHLHPGPREGAGPDQRLSQRTAGQPLAAAVVNDPGTSFCSPLAERVGYKKRSSAPALGSRAIAGRTARPDYRQPPPFTPGGAIFFRALRADSLTWRF
jgi:hypothetical protein